MYDIVIFGVFSQICVDTLIICANTVRQRYYICADTFYIMCANTVYFTIIMGVDTMYFTIIMRENTMYSAVEILYTRLYTYYADKYNVFHYY